MKKMQLNTPPKQGSETPFQRFCQVAQRIVNTPKHKIEKCEQEQKSKK